MKVSIGTKIQEGPWGGGNLFAINLKNYLTTKGHQVVSNLYDDDIDIVLITEPRKSSESSAYTHFDVKKYIDYVNPQAVVVHRINECDERKNTNYVNKYLISVNKFADQTIFVSTWLKNLYEEQGISEINNNVVMAGANKEIFNNKNFKPWNGEGKIKIVTHHWGANWNKGFDSYALIDELIGQQKWKDKLEFSYIGNLPKNFSFKNSYVVEPLSGTELANEIKKNHLYITGSINEPSGNHHIEGAQCGLPLLYINSGGVPEYCNNFGVMFEKNNLEIKLEEIINNYQKYLEKIDSYPFNSDNMSEHYLNLFENNILNKEKIIQNRSFNKSHSKITKKSYMFLREFKKRIRKINLN
ncbi:MAG: hypothetical protein CBC28_01690 [Flavobacteriaceae bacterium TMED68]|nr:MAG: hypothetical protein CBC28_01690 [Flavobacteriaceae bacterium TMED68]|tara:strand:- start:5511 stop:6578 length:1068 start_codon:yes stop_codon:yes gene_type:complete